MNNLTNKIKNFFEEINCSIELILENKYNNIKKENIMNEEIYLPKYTVIYKGKDIMLNFTKYKKKLSFQKENNIDIGIHNLSNISNLKDHLTELKSEGYKIKYSNK